MLALVDRAKHDLITGRIPQQGELTVTQKLSRALDRYESPPPAARATIQLKSAGREISPGQSVRFLLRGGPGVHAVDLDKTLAP